jgi:hypothetical protein
MAFPSEPFRPRKQDQYRNPWRAPYPATETQPPSTANSLHPDPKNKPIVSTLRPTSASSASQEAAGRSTRPAVEPLPSSPSTWPFVVLFEAGCSSPKPESQQLCGYSSLVVHHHCHPPLPRHQAQQDPIAPPPPTSKSQLRAKNQKKEKGEEKEEEEEDEPYEKLGSAALLPGSVPDFSFTTISQETKASRNVDTEAVCRFFHRQRVRRKKREREMESLVGFERFSQGFSCV